MNASLFTTFNKQRKIKSFIVYGTTSGNAELVSEVIGDALNYLGIETVIQRAETASSSELINFDLIVLVSSTWNVGQLNDHFIEFNNNLRKSKTIDKFFQVVGLGDSKHYDIFCGAADILNETVKIVDGKPLMETLRIDGPPYPQLLEINKWAQELGKKLLAVI